MPICSPTRILYPAKFSIIVIGGNKIFQEKNKFKLYLFTNLAIQRVLEEKSNTRKLAISKKLQATDNLTLANHKEGKHTQSTTKNNRN